MLANLLSRLPHVSISTNMAVLISALVISLAAALYVLIRNRPSLAVEPDGDSDLGALFDNPAAIMPHIVELRNRVINSLLGILVTTVVATLLSKQILAVLAEPVGGLQDLQAIGVTEPFGVFFRIALTVGIILASPFVIAQLWIFIAAGLKPSERRLFYLLVPFAVILFLAGVAFAFFVMLPVAVPFLVNFLGVHATPTLENYIKFVSSVLLWVGVSFEMPLIMFVLAKIGIVNTRMLAQNWRIAIVAIAVLAAVITPTPDPVNMGIVSAPLILLYLLSIVLTLFA